MDRADRADGMSLTVLKLGGLPLDDAALRGAFAAAVALRPGGMTVVVHGGGLLINAYQERLGLPVRKVAGLRVTDDAGLELAEMLLSGLCNERLTAALLAAGVDAGGFLGWIGGCFAVCARRWMGRTWVGWGGDAGTARGSGRPAAAGGYAGGVADLAGAG